jgi:hypothetical protein
LVLETGLLKQRVNILQQDMKRKTFPNGEIHNSITTVGYHVITYLRRACAYCNNSPIEYDVTRDFPGYSAWKKQANLKYRLSVQKRYLDNEIITITQTL